MKPGQWLAVGCGILKSVILEGLSEISQVCAFPVVVVSFWICTERKKKQSLGYVVVEEVPPWHQCHSFIKNKYLFKTDSFTYGCGNTWYLATYGNFFGRFLDIKWNTV